MTVASEITRISNAKDCIRQAIIDKGVSVPANLTIDCYASCIASIKKGMEVFNLKYTVVGGGGGGGGGGYAGQGGGGGEVKVGGGLSTGKSYTISIGSGGAGCGRNKIGGCGGCSKIVDSAGIMNITANGGVGGGYSGYGNIYGTSGSGCPGGNTCCYCGGGGGGTCGAGQDAGASSCYGGDGGLGLCGYGGGGGGGASYGSNYIGKGCCGGGNGGYSTDGCPATNYGGGGGGGGNNWTCCGGNGYQGLVKICYQCNSACSGITSATGGTKSTTTEGGVIYCVHTFTSSGTFCIVC